MVEVEEFLDYHNQGRVVSTKMRLYFAFREH